ncbi:MAG: indole-3-glycerol phosphate synthase TrpC [Egibacteraceae bacterium]
MTNFLDEACAAARARTTAAAAVVSLGVLRRRVAGADPPPGLVAALAAPGVTVVAEVKRASPSRGPIAPIPDPAALARSYAEGGAGAVSVLTEPHWFCGSLADVEAVVGAVAIPVLRKDFVVEEYQVWEARASGASAVLLIVAALDDPQLQGLLAAADRAGLDALVEVHDAGEATRAATAHAAAATGRRLVVGVNARDLTSLKVDPDRFAAVVDALPAGALAVAESGVKGPDDVRRLGALGADAVLVGEHVACADDPAVAVRALATAGAQVADASTGAPR